MVTVYKLVVDNYDGTYSAISAETKYEPGELLVNYRQPYFLFDTLANAKMYAKLLCLPLARIWEVTANKFAGRPAYILSPVSISRDESILDDFWSAYFNLSTSELLDKFDGYELICAPVGTVLYHEIILKKEIEQ